MTNATLTAAPSSAPARGLVPFCASACAFTWVLATPAAWAWVHDQAPSGFAVACAGLSAFGPLLAVLVFASSSERKDAFRRWRAPFAWLAFAVLAPAALHVSATALYVLLGGQVHGWLHPPSTPEAWAALVVFPLGEEFAWRGYAYPKLAERFGTVRGSLVLGAVWGLWHLAYSVTPEKAGFDAFAFGTGILQLTLISLLISWVMERCHRSMAVALLFHAGAHLDHFERSTDYGPGLFLCYLVVLILVAVLTARSLSHRPSP